MKLFNSLAVLLAGAASVLSLPVPDHEIVARGDGVVYTETTKTIVVTTYVVTETEFLYEAKCDYGKWGINCDCTVISDFSVF